MSAGKYAFDSQVYTKSLYTHEYFLIVLFIELGILYKE